MKHILLPTDFSDNSWNAIRYALSMFKKKACSFHILTVNIIPSFSGAQSNVQFNQEKLRRNILRQSETDLQHLLKRIHKHLPDDNHKFNTVAVYGSFIDTVQRMVVKHKIELIVMGTKGATGLKKIIVGSNTAAIISKVDCPLLAVPENARYKKLREIAFATDFKVAYNHKMLDTLKEVVTLTKTPLIILNVLEKEKDLNDEQTLNKEFLTDYFKDLESNFYTLSKSGVEEAVQCFAESRDIDIIVMLAKNRSFLQKILIRPTVQHFSYHLDIPFLVLHE